MTALAGGAAAAQEGASPPKIDLKTALDMARKNDAVYQAAVTNAALAREDRKQAKALLLPTLSYFNQYIYTQGNGIGGFVYVANDGVHVYNSQADVREDLSFSKHSDYQRTAAMEAAAAARRDIAARGLTAVVTQSYYALVTAGRKVEHARQSLDDARKFVTITTDQERGGEAARADVVKAQLTQEQRRRDVQDMELAAAKAKIALAVLLFPDFRQDYAVADDLDQAPALAPMEEVRTMAGRKNPEIREAIASLKAESYGVASARGGYLPVFSMDYFYGIDANTVAVFGQAGARQLGSSVQGSLTIPLWNWGATSSRVRQAKLREDQARRDLSLAQRQLLANLESYYQEAASAQSQVDSLKRSLDLAAESLRLTLLRYEAGEATALEVTDAQASLAQARNGYDDGLNRYRISLAALQTLTGI